MRSPRTASPTHSRRAAAQPRRVLIALSPQDRRAFLGTAALRLGARVIWARASDLVGPAWPALLRRTAPEVIVTGWSTPPLPAAWVSEPSCPLRYVCHLGGSVRIVVPRAFVERGGLVSNWGVSVGPQVAEHALLLALAALRRLPAWRGVVAARGRRRGDERLETETLFQRRVGIHGFGAVARSLLVLLRPFEVDIAVYSHGVPPAAIRAAGARPSASLRELFSHSEVLFECEALRPDTERSVTPQLLRALPRGAVFVNVGRGRVVDEAALARAARSGRVRVAVDVLASEPAPADSPLLRLSEVLVSPHIGGPTTDRYRACGAFGVANVRRYLAGRRPEALVTPTGYDRST